MRENYFKDFKVDETPTRVTIDCVSLLNDCYSMICHARAKLPKSWDGQIHIVLPVDHLRALRYYLASNPSKQMSVVGSLNPYDNRLFGAILHDSAIAETVFVY